MNAPSAPPVTTESPDQEDDVGGRRNETKGYLRFGAMIATSMVVMFVIMYLNTYQLSHVQWSETRFYMAFLMGAAMAVVMLSFMWSMHRDLGRSPR